MTLQDAFRKLDDVRDEYGAARLAIGHVLVAGKNDPSLNDLGGQGQITFRHLESCARNLEITYFVRLFAEFEGVLRDYWLDGRKRKTNPPMIDLINSIASYCFVNNDDMQNAHEVREYRNDVIHDHLQHPRFDFQTCRSRLASFVRWLPRKW